MSVPNQTPYNIYTANGLTTVFPYEFYLLNAGDLAVSLNGSVITSGYTISGVGNVDGGDVSFLTPPANGVTVMIERVIPTYRLTDYQNNGDLLADTVNKDFDRLWMAIQQAFIYLGLALTRPLLGGPFNAKGFRIENLGNPVNGSDAATKNYVDETGKTNLQRVLRFPENVAAMPDAETRGHSLQGYTEEGRPTPVFSMTDTADLALKLASTGGAGLVGFDIEKTYPIATIGHQFTNIFSNAQHLEFYYDKLGDWDEAYFQAQMNVFRLGFSPEVLLPGGVVDIYRPFFGGPAIGDLIHARHPELGLYNGDGTYKGTWPLILKGVYKKNEDGLTNPYTGTQIVFHGCADQNDNT